MSTLSDSLNQLGEQEGAINPDTVAPFTGGSKKLQQFAAKLATQMNRHGFTETMTGRPIPSVKQIQSSAWTADRQKEFVRTALRTLNADPRYDIFKAQGELLLGSRRGKPGRRELARRSELVSNAISQPPDQILGTQDTTQFGETEYKGEGQNLDFPIPIQEVIPDQIEGAAGIEGGGIEGGLDSGNLIDDLRLIMQRSNVDLTTEKTEGLSNLIVAAIDRSLANGGEMLSDRDKALLMNSINNMLFEYDDFDEIAGKEILELVDDYTTSFRDLSQSSNPSQITQGESSSMLPAGPLVDTISRHPTQESSGQTVVDTSLEGVRTGPIRDDGKYDDLLPKEKENPQVNNYQNRVESEPTEGLPITPVGGGDSINPGLGSAVAGQLENTARGIVQDPTFSFRDLMDPRSMAERLVQGLGENVGRQAARQVVSQGVGTGVSPGVGSGVSLGVGNTSQIGRRSNLSNDIRMREDLERSGVTPARGTVRIKKTKPIPVSTRRARNQIALVQNAVAGSRAYRDIFQSSFG